MAIVYFGANIPLSTMNGNWSDITQWYSFFGTGGKGAQPAVYLNRFPNPATDTVQMIQEVKSNGGTYTGTYPSGSWTYGSYAGPIIYANLNDPNCTWSGTMTSGFSIQQGTVTGNLSGVSGLNIYGGTFTNTVTFPTNTSWNFFEVIGLTTQRTITFPANFSITTSGQIQIGRDMVWSYPINFTGSASIYYNNLYFTRGNQSGNIASMTFFPANINNFTIIGSPKSGQPLVAKNISSVFPNSTSLTFGSSTSPCLCNFMDVAFDIPVTIYTGNGYTGQFYSGWYLGNAGKISITYTNLTFKLSTGYTYAPFFINGPYTWVSTVYTSLLPSLSGTKKIVDYNTIPLSYGFGVNGSTFTPTTILNLTKNIGAILE